MTDIDVPGLIDVHRATAAAVHTLTLADVSREHRRSRPDFAAYVDGERAVTYRELDERTNRLASRFASHGCGPGGRVLWLGRNAGAVLESMVACAKVGALLCIANWRCAPDELEYVAGDLDPQLVLYQDDGRALDEAIAPVTRSARWLRHDTGGHDEYEPYLRSGSETDLELEVSQSWPVVAVYSSAFEGRPKIARLSHHALLFQSLAYARTQDISDESVFLCSGPLFHLASLMNAITIYHHGGCNVFSPRADAEEMCRLIEAYGCTHAFVMGPTLEEIRRLNADGRFDLSSLWSDATASEWSNPWCAPASSGWARDPGGYGQSEVSGMATFRCLGAPALGNAGRPSPVASVRILDEDGVELDVGETGEIAVRGPIVMTGPNVKWHRTGDLGRRERDGSITFVGPKQRLIKSGAENVYPAEVERCIKELDAVADACVFGAPDERWAQNVAAIVVLVPGATLSADKVAAHCKLRLASYKKPKTIHFAAELPLKNGFVDRDAVDELYGGGGYPGAGS